MNDADREQIKNIGAQLDELNRAIRQFSAALNSLRKVAKTLTDDYFDFTVKHHGDPSVEIEESPAVESADCQETTVIPSARSCATSRQPREKGRFVSRVSQSGNSPTVE